IEGIAMLDGGGGRYKEPKGVAGGCQKWWGRVAGFGAFLRREMYSTFGLNVLLKKLGNMAQMVPGLFRDFQ
nr:hypothetical protein [Tanacetum cinerariifolium]